MEIPLVDLLLGLLEVAHLSYLGEYLSLLFGISRFTLALVDHNQCPGLGFIEKQTTMYPI